MLRSLPTILGACDLASVLFFTACSTTTGPSVIEVFEGAGFEFVASSEINAKDKPAQKAAMMAIGESDRMTLTFRKK